MAIVSWNSIDKRSTIGINSCRAGNTTGITDKRGIYNFRRQSLELNVSAPAVATITELKPFDWLIILPFTCE